jgi:hypothetical protein
MKSLRDGNIITNEVFMIQINKNISSVVKFGGWDSSAISGDLTVLECSDSSSFTLDVSQTFINGSNVLPSSSIRVARLDIQQPYLYLPKDDYTSLVNGINTYLVNLNCDQDLNICRWNRPCSTVTDDVSKVFITI